MSGGPVRPLFCAIILAVAAAASGGASLATPGTAARTAGCSTLAPPPSLPGMLLSLHRTYELHRPDVHDPDITGPVGRVDLGVCGEERYALAWFDARYNGHYFGIEDQPERFVEPSGERWRDIGNTGGDPCGAAPTTLLKAWKIVRSCPG